MFLEPRRSEARETDVATSVAAVGGTIGLVQEGDSITVDADQLLLQLNVDEAELERRRAGWSKPEPRYRNGILGKYARLVSSSSRGATTDHAD